MKKLVLILAVLTGTAHAAPDPKAIQKDIDKELANLESKLGSGNVYEAKNLAGKLEDLYGKLKDATSGNDKSNAEKGKEDARRLEEALMAADQLKQNEKLGLKLSEQCGRGKLMITEAIKSFEKKNDASAIKILPEAAESARKLVEKPFADARSLRKNMDGWHRTAVNFNPKLDVWRDIKSDLKETADKSLEMYAEAFDKTEEECTRVAKGKNHPEVLAALKLLTSNHDMRAKTLGGIEKEVRQYVTMIRGFREWYRGDMDKITSAYCAANEDDSDEIDAAPIDAVINRAKGELSQRAQRITDEYKLLASALEDAKAVAPSGSKELERITKAMDKLETAHDSFKNALAKEPLVQGANDPRFRALTEAGKLAHTQIQGRCKQKEVRIDGENRPDCMDFDQCLVVEIKPDTPAGRAAGDEQRERYKDALEKLFKDRPKFDKQFPALAKQCTAGNKLGLRYEVALYDFCPKSVDVGFDARLTNPGVFDELEKLDLDGK